MVQHISVRIADVHDELKRVLKHLREFPSPTSVMEVHGPSSKSVRHFYTQLSLTAETAGNATESVMEELAKMDLTIRAALEDITNHDADLATSATWFEDLLDSAGEAPVETNSDSGTSPDASAGANLRSQPPGGRGKGRP